MTAAASPPPVPRMETVATCAEPANVVADITVAASPPTPAAWARTANDAPNANAAGVSPRIACTPSRKPLRGGMPRTVSVHLLPVAADLHVAPRPRAVLRLVEERPVAVVGAAGLQPRPV